MTKSSIEIAKTMIAARDDRRDEHRQQRESTPERRRARGRRRPPRTAARSRAAVRAMITTKTSEKVMCPIACATVPSCTNVSRWMKTRSSAVAHDDLGRDERQEQTTRDVPAAATAPARQPDRERDPERDRDEHGDRRQLQALHEGELRVGSWSTESTGSPVYQRSDQPCADA